MLGLYPRRRIFAISYGAELAARGEHRQRLRADLAVGLAFLLVVHQGALSDIAVTP